MMKVRNKDDIDVSGGLQFKPLKMWQHVLMDFSSLLLLSPCCVALHLSLLSFIVTSQLSKP